MVSYGVIALTTMQLITPVRLTPSKHFITHCDKMLSLGSCFAENIGQRLVDNKFEVDINPMGTLYNPCSIAEALERIIRGELWREEELFIHNGLYHSWGHHSRFSGVNPFGVLSAINSRLSAAHRLLPICHTLLITFGSSYVFSREGDVVANCHKLPAGMFERRRLTTEEIVACWTILIEKLLTINPSLTIVFTVSPIRHLADGAHDNQLSKSTLLLATDELCHRFPQISSYFPSYEIMMDELRDYRFYAEDMTHPSTLAIDYIEERFSTVYFSRQTQEVIGEWRSLQKMLQHRTMNPNSEEGLRFAENKRNKLSNFRTKYPYIDLSIETERLNETL